jgi:beta-phosphoglucomutase-like phosphatase (HAD superfamily)
MPAFLFDLDGTLIDSVYQQVLAWHDALHRVEVSSRYGVFIAGSE